LEEMYKIMLDSTNYSYSNIAASQMCMF